MIHPRFQWVHCAAMALLTVYTIETRSYGKGWEHGAITLEALIQDLEFDSPQMRMRAAQSLGIRGQKEALGLLLKCH